MKTSKQYILLDWDGNLAKTLDVWLAAVRITLEKRGIHLEDKEIAQCFGKVSQVFPQWGVTDLDEAITEMDEEAYRGMPGVELYPDALFVLEKLKQNGKHTALISTSFRKNVVPVLHKYEIHKFFDVVMGWEDSKEHKPHPEPLEKALQKLGGTKAEAIMIGDTDNDIQAANNAGIESILFYPPEHERFYSLDELTTHKPTHVVYDFREVLDLV